MSPDEIIKIGRILKNFGKRCYWYGEETGDYSMDHLGIDILSEATVAIEKVLDEKNDSTKP